MEQENNVLLNSLLADMDAYEGVLVCRNVLPEWEESAIARAFMTFQFAPSPADDVGVNFLHADSGTTLCYYGNSLSIDVGGQIVEAMDDLLRVLAELGWVNVDVYSIHGAEFYADFSRQMPATVEIQLVLQDIPIEMDESLSEFSTKAALAVQQHQIVASPYSSKDEFMSAFRTAEGIAPSPGPLAHTGNDSFSDPYTSELPVPLAAAIEKGKTVISLNTPSPVSTGLPKVMQFEVDPMDAELVIPDSLPSLSATTANMGIGVTVISVQPVAMDAVAAISHVELATLDIRPPEALVIPKSVEIEKVQVERVISCAPLLVNEQVKPSDVYVLGNSIVVLDAPWSSMDCAEIEALAIGGVHSPREIVFFEPGATALSDRHVEWDLFGEILDGPEGMEAARLLVTSLWPERPRVHLLLTALILMMREDAGVVNNVAALIGLVNANVATHLQRLEKLGATNPVFAKLAMALRQQLGCTSMDAALQESVQDLWSVLLLPTVREIESADVSVRPAPVSFRALAHSQEAKVIVLTLDALDEGSAAEFFVKGVLRLVPRLAQSRRIKNRAIPAVSTAPVVLDVVDSVEQSLSREEINFLSQILSRLKGGEVQMSA